MRGLIQKDLYILMEMKRMAAVILAVALALLLLNDGFEGFVVSYLSFVAMFVVLATLTQDETSKGIQYLMTLPVTRKIYVQEKYLLGISLGLGTWLISTMASGALVLARGREIRLEFLLTCLIYAVILLILLSLMIPVQLRFGGDKGRIAVMVAVAGGILACLLLAQAAAWANLDFGGAAKFLGRRLPVLVVLAVLILAGILMISYRISLAVMRKKEF